MEAVLDGGRAKRKAVKRKSIATLAGLCYPGELLERELQAETDGLIRFSWWRSILLWTHLHRMIRPFRLLRPHRSKTSSRLRR